MTVLEQAHTNLQSLYNRLWHDWYKDIVNVTKSPIVVEQGIHAPGYLKGSIYLFIDGFDLDGAAEQLQHDPVKDVRKMPSWQRDLIHEMMHEYQDKVARHSDPSEDGKALFANPPKPFPGPGHDVWFYSAIATHAAYFGVSVDEFASEL